MMGMSIISPVLPAYALGFGVALGLVGLLISAFAVARVLLDIPAGIFASAMSIKRLMLIGLVIVSLSSFAAGTAINYPMLLAARVFEGAGSALYTTTSITAVSRLAPEGSRGAHLSFYISMFLVGTSFGPAIGGFVSDRFGLGSPFIVYGMCTTISVLMILFWIEDITPLHDGAKKVSLNRLGRLLVRWDLLAINLATIAIFVTRQGVLNTLVPLYSKYNLGLGEGALGTILTLSAVCNLGTMLVAGRMTDIYGRKPFMIISLIMLAVIVCLIPLTTDSLGFTIVLMAAGLAIGLTGPVAAWITDVVPEDLAEAMGLFRTMGDLGFVIAPFALASIAGEAGESMGATSFIIAGIALVVLSLPLLSIKDPVAEKRKTID
jgi:predicted MFS family arabinose efflux permease